MELSSVSTVLLSFLLISGCSASAIKPNDSDKLSVKAESWKNTGISEQVFKKAGGEATDCGFHDLLTEEGIKSVQVGFDCVRKEVKTKTPFVYGTLRIPEDSYAHELLISTSSGEFWIVTYDRMLKEDDHQLWLNSCKSVQLFNKYRTYKGVSCVERNPEDWL